MSLVVGMSLATRTRTSPSRLETCMGKQRVVPSSFSFSLIRLFVNAILWLQMTIGTWELSVGGLPCRDMTTCDRCVFLEEGGLGGRLI